MSDIGSDNGWLEAAIAWEVCASLHRQYCKGKDALFTTRQSDFVKHAENARWRAAHGQAPATVQADSVQEDAARLDWLLLRISGAEFRRLGVHYSGNARRADVDAARKQGENHGR